MKKTIKIFGIGAAVLLVLMAFGSVVAGKPEIVDATDLEGLTIEQLEELLEHCEGDPQEDWVWILIRIAVFIASNIIFVPEAK